MVVRGQKMGEGGATGKGCRVSFGDDANILKWIVVMVAQLCEDTENHLAVDSSWGAACYVNYISV